MAVVFCCLLSFLLFSYMFNTSSGHICFSCLDVCFIIFGWSSFFWIQIRRIWSKMTKKFCLVHFISQEPYIIWFSFMVLMCKMILPPQIFFIFSKFWFSGLLGGKGQIAQNDKTFGLSCSISQEPYILWSSFVVHKCKMIISPGFFYFFKILIFWFLGGSKGKHRPKW